MSRPKRCDVCERIMPCSVHVIITDPGGYSHIELRQKSGMSKLREELKTLHKEIDEFVADWLDDDDYSIEMYDRLRGMKVRRHELFYAIGEEETK